MRPKTSLLAPALLLAAATAGLLSGCARPDTDPKTTGTLPPSPQPKVVVHWPLPDFTYRNTLGEPFGLASLKGKVWIASFIFVRCSGPCPDMTRAMASIQRETAGVDDLHLVSFTIRPESETETDLAQYAERFKADQDRWHFLRGPSNAAVADLQQDAFKAGGAGHHTALFFLVDQDGTVRRFWDARDAAERALLIRDARLLLSGSSLEDTIGQGAAPALR